MNFRLLVKTGPRWRRVADAVLDDRTATLPPAALAESDEVRIAFTSPSDPPPALRVLVGSVPVASTLPTDRVAGIEYEDVPGAEETLACRGRFFADWIGNTELTVAVRTGDAGSWQTAVRIPVAVTAGKISGEQFARLFEELEKESAAVLLDVYGKTQIGLKAEGPLASSAPVEVLHRVREAVQSLDDLLRKIAKQPACKLRPTPVRELAAAGQAVAESTLQAACADSSLLCRVNGRVHIREHLHDRSRADFRVPEHRTIADFGEYLRSQLADLRFRIDAEIREREARRNWRNESRGSGQATWWELEDQPRIESLAACRDAVGHLRRRVEAWSALHYLPPGTPLRAHPQLTPLFRTHPLYRRVYRVMATHSFAFRATLDAQPVMAKARSLPVLYEWWCAVRVLRTLLRVLTPAAPSDSSPITSQLARGRTTFTVEFAADQSMSFDDGRGGTVRFRYNPVYARDDAIGLLDGGLKRTPDIALEIFPANSPSKEIPALIAVFDAKYSSLSQKLKADEVKAKYSAIGDLRTGSVLSRQVWALTPVAAEGTPDVPELRNHCTVDNHAFWSESFAMTNPVTGAIEVRPVAEGEFDPLNALLELLLKRSGISW